MNSKRTYKGLAYLTVLFVVLPVVALQYSVGESLARHARIVYLRAQTDILKLELRSMSAKNNSNPTRNKELLLCGEIAEQIGRQGGVLVEKYTPTITSKNESTQITTSQITLCGSYVELLQAIEYTERTLPNVKLISTVFEIKTDYRIKTNRLVCTLLIQQLTHHTP